MQVWRKVLRASVITGVAMVSSIGFAASSRTAKEDYLRAPMPSGFQVIVTELEGPVFADEKGRTLYKWPKSSLRNGDAGEIEGKPTCDDKVYRENAGLMSPYPGGFELPEVDTRPSCTQVWPPVIALPGATAVGKWTVVDRPDGRKQWAYDGFALYTSDLDKKPGDVLGASELFRQGERGALRSPVVADSNVPSQFDVETTVLGRMVTLRDGWSIYAYDKDGRNKSTCYASCLQDFEPIVAGEYARPIGEWTIFERTPGVKQWAFRGMPVYRHLTDLKTHALDGSDNPGWRNVYAQMAPSAPKGFAPKDTIVGSVLGDAQGKTIYYYVCTDDAVDQLACDHPAAPQIYRLMICGGGDADRCVKTFPYVLAAANARSDNDVWTTMDIDPKTGKVAERNQPGALHVWALRGRPVYTYAGDVTNSDINAHGWGEWNGQRNGFRAIVLRDIFSSRDR